MVGSCLCKVEYDCFVWEIWNVYLEIKTNNYQCNISCVLYVFYKSRSLNFRRCECCHHSDRLLNFAELSQLRKIKGSSSCQQEDWLQRLWSIHYARQQLVLDSIKRSLFYSALSILRCLLYRNAAYYDTKAVFQALPNNRNLHWLYR